jgi:hypothetical protein
LLLDKIRKWKTTGVSFGYFFANKAVAQVDNDAMNIQSGHNNVMNMVESTSVEISRSKPLSELTIGEVGRLLESIEFDEYKGVFAKNKIDGNCLIECNTSDDVVNMGISIVVKARIFLNKVMIWKANGVPIEYFSANLGTDQDDRF